MLNTIRSKPLMCFSLVFLVGSFAAVYIPTLPKAILTGFFLLTAFLILLFGNKLLRRIYDFDRIKPIFAVLCIGAFLSFGISLLTFDLYAERFSEKAEQQDNVTIEITDVVYSSSFRSRYYATVTESELFAEDFRIILDSSDLSFLPRDIIKGAVLYKPLEEDINGYNEKRYALSQKIVLAAEDVSLSYCSRSKGFSLSGFFSELNNKLAKTLYRYTEEEEGALSAALLLGRKDELPDSLQRDFLRLGILHLLCLSGAHLAILSTLLESILLKVRIKRKIRSLINIAAVLFFMAITGFPPSLVRAGVMLILANIAFFIGRTPDYSTSLTLACSLIVAFNPFSALDYGLHLSFVAAHSCFISGAVSHRIVSFFTVKKRWKLRKLRILCNRLIRFTLRTAIYNLVITVNILPLTFLYYGEMSLISLPANLLFIPLITLLMYVTLAFFLLSPFMVFSPFLSEMIVLLTTLVTSISEKLSSLRGIMLCLGYWFVPLFIIPILFLTAVSFSGQKKTIRRASMVSVCIFVLLLGAVGVQTLVDRDHVTTEYVTKGKNDGFLLKSGNQLLVCEVSDASYSFASFLTSYRFDFNCSEIEAYMLTHYHTKHIAALSKLTDRCIVRTFILPSPVTETDADVYHALCDLAEEKNIRVVLTDRHHGDTLTFNRASVETYPVTLLSRSDHPVIALRLSCGENEVMYLGGSFNEGDSLITEHAKEAEFLVFGGHSPVYKKVFDPQIAESKTVYVSEFAEESLSKLTPDVSGELKNSPLLKTEEQIRLD